MTSSSKTACVEDDLSLKMTETDPMHSSGGAAADPSSSSSCSTRFSSIQTDSLESDQAHSLGQAFTNLILNDPSDERATMRSIYGNGLVSPNTLKPSLTNHENEDQFFLFPNSTLLEPPQVSYADPSSLSYQHANPAHPTTKLPPPFMRLPLDRDDFGTLSPRRESYPCSQSTTIPAYTTSSAKPTTYWNDNSLSAHDILDLVEEMPSVPFRKYSIDMSFSALSKTKKHNLMMDGYRTRLSPSYSNPDLAAARRSSDIGMMPFRFRENNDARQDRYPPPSYPQPPLSTAFNRTPYAATTPVLPAFFGDLPAMQHAALYQQYTALATMYGGAQVNPVFLNQMLQRQMNHLPASTPPSPTRKTAMIPNRRFSEQQQQSDSRFMFAQFDDVVGQIYPLCKDQYGCRFFQRKLEERQEAQRDVIFKEVFPHFVELMTDPFGNYLCQKLLEYCTDTQRTMIVEQVAKDMVSISLNMHGTRAMQKLIEFLTLPQQITLVVGALTPHVVTLIKDLNGNHVIQRCLHRLSTDDKQFIYDAVSQFCVEVATHRHGCCVLQRCIDFSADHQKTQLVVEVIRHGLTLVLDPYGNYVVQYVLDLGDAMFSDRLIRQFIGHVAALSVQKFSSNVIEKCIRVAETDTRRHLIEELVDKPRLEKLLHDSYANYVVQTALDYAEPSQREKLVECIRPILPSVRHTPYGKRIHSKINRDQQQLQQHQSQPSQTQPAAPMQPSQSYQPPPSPQAPERQRMPQRAMTMNTLSAPLSSTSKVFAGYDVHPLIGGDFSIPTVPSFQSSAFTAFQNH